MGESKNPVEIILTWPIVIRNVSDNVFPEGGESEDYGARDDLKMNMVIDKITV